MATQTTAHASDEAAAAKQLAGLIQHACTAILRREITIEGACEQLQRLGLSSRDALNYVTAGLEAFADAHGVDLSAERAAFAKLAEERRAAA